MKRICEFYILIGVRVFESFKRPIYMFRDKKYESNRNVFPIEGGYIVTVWDGTKIFVSKNEIYGEEETVGKSNENFGDVLVVGNKDKSRFLARVSYRYT